MHILNNRTQSTIVYLILDWMSLVQVALYPSITGCSETSASPFFTLQKVAGKPLQESQLKIVKEIVCSHYIKPW